MNIGPFRRDKGERFWSNEDLVRSEQFGPDRLEQHAASLAAAQASDGPRAGGQALARRLRENDSALLQAYRAIARAVENGHTITPSAEWILDNYHIVEEQIFQIKGDLPPGYYRQLPRIAQGHFAGLPRVFGIAWAYVAHMDSRFDVDTLCRMLAAYQRVHPLTIGELWAVAITLRIVLVENLRRAAQRIVRSHRLRRRADAIADRVLGLTADTPIPISEAMQRLGPTFPPTLLVQLAHRLRDPGPLVTSSIHWLDEQAVRQGGTMDDFVAREHQRQAAMNVTVRNIITSMRQISAIDWGEIFERVSLVDDALRKGSRFAEFDFQTRDSYRREIENIARHSNATELEVTRLALDLAHAAEDPAGRDGDPGYYLVGDGAPVLRQRIGYAAGPVERIRAGLGRIGVAGYVALVGVASAAVLGLALGIAVGPGTPGLLVLALAVLGIVPASELATGILNRILATAFVPKALPSLDFQGGVPDESRTLVAVPALLTSTAAVDELLSALEVHYLGNTGPNIVFALLTDWQDSPSETSEDDARLLALAVEGIAELNRRHVSRGGPRFHLLHRRRQWNEAQGTWMGWERKRGKLQELNRLLRGESGTSFVPLNGTEPALPEGIRYVITLDADTRMPRDTVAKLAGRMAHPLNRPVFDGAERRVVKGYGIIQPRVTMALPMRAGGSWFQRVFSGSPGMDPYAAPISDLYQDMFREGSFIGKGIYDVDAVEAAMEGRAPDNAILSHDLYEGNFARSGLASDVELMEEFPRRYDVAVSRMHRWVRGDWQLLPWISGRKQEPPAAPLLGRWKMLDNLRRSLFAPSAVAALFAGWLLPPLGRAGLDDLRARRHRASLAGVEPHRVQLALHQALLAAKARRTRHECLAGSHAVRLPRRHPRPSGRPDARCDRAYALAARGIAAASPRLDHGRTGEPRARDEHRRLLPLDGAQRRGCRARPGRRLHHRAAYRSRRAALCHRLGGGAGIGLLRQPLHLPFPRVLARRGRRARPAPHRQADLAVLRALRHGGGELAASRQLPGAAAGSDRAPDVADQYRPLPALHRLGPRFRLDRRQGHGRAARGDAWHDEPDAPVPRPFLQLVRHRRPPAARSAIRLDSRQRQSRGPSHRPRQCLRGGDRQVVLPRAHRGRA